MVLITRSTCIYLRVLVVRLRDLPTDLKRNGPHLLALLFVALHFSFQAQETERTFVRGGDIFGTRVFIENRGQFRDWLRTSDSIFFMVDNGYERIYFTETGAVFEFIEWKPITERQKERLEDDKYVKPPANRHVFVKMSWLNARHVATVTGSEKQSHYFTYSDPAHNSYGYKKITYKGVYDNIDVEYLIPADKAEGVKYNFILHPGARISDIAIAYTGDVDRISRSGENVVIKCGKHVITEHTPETFVDGRRIDSQFRLKSGVIGFEADAPVGSAMVIDPWVTTNTSLTSNQRAYDVDYDNSGNVFIYGGASDLKIAKYDAAGTLLWTFPGILSAQSWSSTGYPANFVVIKSNGKCYTGQGFEFTGTRIIRLNSSGNYDNLISNNVVTWRELWDMAYHCSTGKVYGMGGSTNSTHSAGIMHQVTGFLWPMAFVTGTSTAGHDVVCHTIDDSGEFFWLYAANSDAVIDNKLAHINAAFTTTTWVQPTNFMTMKEAMNKSFIIPSTAAVSNGFNCLAVNQNYLYYYDGLNLSAYNKVTGAMVAATTVSGHQALRQGGVAVDNCNNLYVGGIGEVRSYHFNGSNFTQQQSIQLGTPTPSISYVFDIKLEKATNLLYVSGREFCGTYAAPACTVQSAVCTSPFPLDYAICKGSTITVASPEFALTNKSYTLMPDGISNTTGSFVVSPATNTGYSVIVNGNLGSSSMTLVALVNVSVFPQPAFNPVVIQPDCDNPQASFSLNLTHSPAQPTSYTLSWSPLPPGVSSGTQTSHTGVMVAGLYQASVVTSDGCTTSTSFSIAAAPDPATFVITPPGGAMCSTAQRLPSW